MPEYMSNRMIEYIKYMSKYRSWHWHVMVGITRSKVIVIDSFFTSCVWYSVSTSMIRVPDHDFGLKYIDTSIAFVKFQRKPTLGVLTLTRRNGAVCLRAFPEGRQRPYSKASLVFAWIGSSIERWQPSDACAMCRHGPDRKNTALCYVRLVLDGRGVAHFVIHISLLALQAYSKNTKYILSSTMPKKRHRGQVNILFWGIDTFSSAYNSFVLSASNCSYHTLRCSSFRISSLRPRVLACTCSVNLVDVAPRSETVSVV